MNINAFYERIAGGNNVPADILSMSIMLLAGFLMTRITKKLKLPNVTAYIVAGILIGPFCLNLIPDKFLEGTAFLPDLALAFIAFGTGQFFKIEALKKNGPKVFVITLFEALMATLLVFILCLFVFRLPVSFSAVLAALAAATAPASTMMTIRQTHAKGEFVDTLLQVVALDDMVGLIAYSISISIATAIMAGQSVSVYGSIVPFLINILFLVLGGFFGLLMHLFMKKRHSTDNRLIIAIAIMFSFCGIAAIMEVSPLLGCMAMGSVYINLSDDDRLFKQLNYFSPPILLLFFVRSGISFDLNALFGAGNFGTTPLIVVGVGYFLIRIIGKYVGSFLGCKIVGLGELVQRYLGLALIPQAGVAIGLAELGARTLKGEMGDALLTIILASSVLYELIGPGTAKFALYKSKSYGNIEDENTSVVETSAEPIQDMEIYVTEVDYGEEINIEESSFDEGAEEYFQNQFEPEETKDKKKKSKKVKGKEKDKKSKKDKDKEKSKEKNKSKDKSKNKNK